jgi:hypothetical protein
MTFDSEVDAEFDWHVVREGRDICLPTLFVRAC